MTEVYLFGRSRLARALLSAGYRIREQPNPYHADRPNWTLPLDQAGAAAFVSAWLTENGYDVPVFIIAACRAEKAGRKNLVNNTDTVRYGGKNGGDQNDHS